MLAEEMLELPSRDGSLSAMCQWFWAVKYAQVLGERGFILGTSCKVHHLKCLSALDIYVYFLIYK